jgi:hypothetical protein
MGERTLRPEEMQESYRFILFQYINATHFGCSNNNEPLQNATKVKTRFVLDN